MTELTWGDLHDATLETVEIRWDAGDVVLRIRTGSALLHLVASAMRHVTCDRRLPWGPSVSINHVRGPALAVDGGASCLEIEMQSGDVLRIEAAAFTTESVPASR